MTPKTRAYVKLMKFKLNECIFYLKMMTCWKNIIEFGIKSVPILKMNLIEFNEFDNESVCSKKFFKTKIEFYSDEVKDFNDKETPKADSDCIFL